MNPFLLAFDHIGDIWYAVPLVVAVSLVYAATRQEEMGAILRQAVRIGVWIVGFMAVIFGILYLMSWAV